MKPHMVCAERVYVPCTIITFRQSACTILEIPSDDEESTEEESGLGRSRVDTDSDSELSEGYITSERGILNIV